MTVENITKVIYDAIDDKLGKDIAILNIGAVSSLCDYFVIATATSATHVRALGDEVEEQLKEQAVEPHHIEGKSTGWIVLDYKSVIVHVFTPKEREFYNLDSMWSDAEEIDLTTILEQEVGD